MADIVERLRFDAARCEVDYSKGVAGNIEEAAAEIERLRAALKQIMDIADEGVVSEAILNRIGHIADETVNIQQSSGERRG